MNLHPVNSPKGDSNRFCGPAAISAVTGMSTGEAARLLRHVTGKRKITGTDTWSVIKALRLCGIGTRTVLNIPRSEAGTLAAWLRNTRLTRGKTIHLIVAANHWQLVQGNRYVCGLTKQIVGLTHPKVKRRGRVTKVMELHLLPGITRPSVPTEARKSKTDAVRKVREKAQALAERIGVIIELESGFSSKTWFVHHPDYTGENDPCEGDHYAFGWHDILDRVQTYQQHIERT